MYREYDDGKKALSIDKASQEKDKGTEFATTEEFIDEFYGEPELEEPDYLSS